MNFDDAISSHILWKTKLLRYIDNHDGSLVPSDIENDHACKLGSWIHGFATKYRHLPEYDRLVADHASFHKQASVIVEKVNAGEYVSPNYLTSPDSPYTIASRNVVSAIFEIRKLVGEDQSDVSPEIFEKIRKDQASAYIKIFRASPEISNIVAESSNRLANDIESILKTCECKHFSQHIIDTIREAAILSESQMFIRILEHSKKHYSGQNKN